MIQTDINFKKVKYAIAYFLTGSNPLGGFVIQKRGCLKRKMRQPRNRFYNKCWGQVMNLTPMS